MTTQSTGFFHYYIRMFTRPRSTFEMLQKSDRKLSYGFFAILVPALGYTLFYAMAWHAGGAPSTFKPWLALPVEEYFKYDIFLTFPGYFMSWVGAASVVFLLIHLFKGKCTYDDILLVIGMGIGIATWSSMLHDLTDAFLSFIGVIDMKAYEKLLNEPTFWRFLLLTLYAIYFFWFITLFSIGIKVVTRFNWLKSIGLAFIGLAVFQVTLFIFIR